jgi:hypothetical protein
VEAGGEMYCCHHCAEMSGVKGGQHQHA